MFPPLLSRFKIPKEYNNLGEMKLEESSSSDGGASAFIAHPVPVVVPLPATLVVRRRLFQQRDWNLQRERLARRDRHVASLRRHAPRLSLRGVLETFPRRGCHAVPRGPRKSGVRVEGDGDASTQSLSIVYSHNTYYSHNSTGTVTEVDRNVFVLCFFTINTGDERRRLILPLPLIVGAASYVARANTSQPAGELISSAAAGIFASALSVMATSSAFILIATLSALLLTGNVASHSRRII